MVNLTTKDELSRKPVKVVRIGTQTGFLLPVMLAHDLGIVRGDFLEILVGPNDEIILKKIKVVRENETAK